MAYHGRIMAYPRHKWQWHGQLMDELRLIKCWIKKLLFLFQEPLNATLLIFNQMNLK